MKKILYGMIVTVALCLVIISARCLSTASIKSDYVNVDLTIDAIDTSTDYEVEAGIRAVA